MPALTPILCVGDIVIFNGAAEWHANMVNPPAAAQSKQIPQLDGDFDSESWELRREETRQCADEDEEQEAAANLLEDNQIVCFYFQKQQRSYLVNNYNRTHRNDEAVNVSDYDYHDFDCNDCDFNLHE